jgi:hypothetical protein
MKYSTVVNHIPRQFCIHHHKYAKASMQMNNFAIDRKSSIQYITSNDETTTTVARDKSAYESS